MDGNSAKKAPVLDHLVGTSNTPTSKIHTSSQVSQTQAKHVLTPMNDSKQSSTIPPKSSAYRDPSSKPISSAVALTRNPNQQNSNYQAENQPKNRRTDKSEFEIELAKTVNKIMLEHFEHASEKIVQRVLSEVRARLPGQRKS